MATNKNEEYGNDQPDQISPSSDNIDLQLTIPGKVEGDVIIVGKGNIIRQILDEKLLKRISRQQLFALILLMGLFVLSIWILGNVRGLRLITPARMPVGNNFNIAITSFTEKELSATDSGIGTLLAEQVHQQIETTMPELAQRFQLTVGIWGPEQVDSHMRITGQTAAERVQMAANLAAEINAHVVIYGVVEEINGGWRVTPEFYVSENSFQEAVEITGQHLVGSPLLVNKASRLSSNIVVSQNFSTRAKAISLIVVGLSFYTAENYEQALTYFQSAAKLEGWRDNEGKEVLYLLIGNTYGQMDNLEAAEASHQLALSINDQYSRAYIGLASTYYLQALRPAVEANNPASADLLLLDKAVSTYQQAAIASYQPELADIATKVHLGLGLTYLAQALASENPNFADAEAEFHAVIDAYAIANDLRIRDLAAESHANLGLIYWLTGNLDQAIKEYETAGALLDSPSTRKTIYTQRVQELQAQMEITIP